MIDDGGTLLDRRDDKANWTWGLYERWGELAESIGLFWGGRWPKLRDGPHVQLRAPPGKRREHMTYEDVKDGSYLEAIAALPPLSDAGWQPAESPLAPIDGVKLREREPVRTVVLEDVDEEGSLYVRKFSGVYTEIDNEGERKLHIRRVWGQG